MDKANNKDKNEEKQLSTTLKRYSKNEKHRTAFPFNATLDKSWDKGKPKNPMLLSPVIRNVLEFLNIEDIKNCRLVSREWGSTGRLVLASRTLIHFRKHKECFPRLSRDFYSCLLDSARSAAVFSTFKISGSLSNKSVKNSWTIEELTKFFDKRQKCIKQLTLSFEYPKQKLVKNIDLSSWILKSPMMKRDAKHMTKLEIEGQASSIMKIPALHLIAHIKDLQLSFCRLNLEVGIKLRPVKLLLEHVTLFQSEIRLDRVRLNDFVDLGTAKEITIISPWRFDANVVEDAKYVLDFCGNATLDNLRLLSVEIVNGETSQWAIDHLEMTDISSYSLNRQMQIKELYLDHCEAIDLFNLPNSIEKLAVGLRVTNAIITLSCSQPIVLENLKYLHIFNTYDPDEPETDYSFLSHFKNCPQLIHLKLKEEYGNSVIEVKSCWLPNSLKTVTLDSSIIKLDLLDDSYLKLEKIVIVYHEYLNVKKMFESKIRVDDVILLHGDSDMIVDEYLTQFLEIRNRFSFGKRLYIGELTWDENEELEDSVLNGLVDEKSSFYVFENEKKGRAISENAFFELADIPKHVDGF